MRLIDNPNRPTEIDGYPVIYREKDGGCCVVERPLAEQQLMIRQYLPMLTYIAEKWGYCPVVGGACFDSSFLLSKELPIWHCNGVYEYSGFPIMGCDSMVSFQVMNSEDHWAGRRMGVPINPFTREIIMNMEQAEALDLTDYDPKEQITKNKGYDGYGEGFEDIRYILDYMGYQPPKVLYWDTHTDPSEEQYED